jgi:hypothetical protein
MASHTRYFIPTDQIVQPGDSFHGEFTLIFDQDFPGQSKKIEW